MTKEEKRLLLQDLCGRLPYGVKVDVDGNIHSLVGLLNELVSAGYDINDFDDYTLEGVKPYLRPIFSMTDEEIFQLGRLTGAASYNMLKGDYSSLEELLKYIYKNHIDYFGLISRGLALEAPEDMYK